MAPAKTFYIFTAVIVTFDQMEELRKRLGEIAESTWWHTTQALLTDEGRAKTREIAPARVRVRYSTQRFVARPMAAARMLPDSINNARYETISQRGTENITTVTGATGIGTVAEVADVIGLTLGVTE